MTIFANVGTLLDGTEYFVDTVLAGKTMAKRIIFKPCEVNQLNLFEEILVDFTWVAGMALSQVP